MQDALQVKDCNSQRPRPKTQQEDPSVFFEAFVGGPSSGLSAVTCRAEVQGGREGKGGR